MNTGMIVIGMALLVFSVALIVTPSGAVPPDTPLPVGAGDVSVLKILEKYVPSLCFFGFCGIEMKPEKMFLIFATSSTHT
jgi:hypothetical protein